MSAGDFFLGMLTAARSPEEMVVRLDWPRRRPGERFAFREIAERHGDFAIAAVACRVRLEGGEVKEITVGIGGVEDRPVVVSADGFAGEEPGQALVEAVAVEVTGVSTRWNDHAASAGQRRTLVRRTLAEACSLIARAAA